MHTTLTVVPDKNVPLLQDYMHSKRLLMHTEALQAVGQSHKKLSQQQLAMSVKQLSLLCTVIYAAAEVRTAM